MTRHYSHRPYSHYAPAPRRLGFWATLMRLAIVCLAVVLLVSGGLWLLGVVVSLVTTVLVLALLAVPFLFVVWVVWLVWRILFGR